MKNSISLIITSSKNLFYLFFLLLFSSCASFSGERIAPSFTYAVKAINNAVFADMESIDKTDSETRQAFFEKHKNGMQNVKTYVGEVTLSK